MSQGLKFDISVPDEGPNETLIFICLNIASVKKNMIDIWDVQLISKSMLFFSGIETDSLVDTLNV